MKWLSVGIVLSLTLCLHTGSVQAHQVQVYADQTENGPVIRPLTTEQTLSAIERATIQPQHRYHALFTPTDPDWKYQWNLEAINMPSAWEAGAQVPFTGSSSVVVAILDTGVAFEAGAGIQPAPDLAGTSIWTNAGETANDSIDNDGNGYIDDVHGWDFVNTDRRPDDDYGHGTHIADIIAGGINNGLSVAGIAPATTLMPIKVLDQNGQGTTDTITNGIRYAVAAGASIINLSLGGDDDDPLLADAIDDARQAGVIVVAASGNDGAGALNFPARYSGVLSVSSVQYDTTRAPYANYGTGLTLMAPGGNPNLDQNNDSLKDSIPAQTCLGIPCASFATLLISGTSQAAAHVSGVLALVRACGATATQAEAAVTSTATDLGAAGYDSGYGHGLINAQAALAAAGCVSSSPIAPANVTVTAGGAAATPLSSTRAWPYNHPAFHWVGSGAVTYTIAWGKVGQTPKTTTTTRNVFQPTITSTGTYNFSVQAVDGAGHTSPIVTRQYYYRPANLMAGTVKSATAYTMKGQRVRTFSAFSNLGLGNASSVNLNGADRLAVSDALRSGVVKVYTSNGSLSQSIRVFSPTAKTGISASFVHQQNTVATLVVASTAFGELRWLDSAGATLLRKVSATDKGYRVASGDLDGDQKDEIVVADRAGSTVRLYRADGTLVWSVRPRGASYRGGWLPAIGDVTGDGRAEIILLPLSDRRDPVLSLLSVSGKRIKTLTMRGQRSSNSFMMTVGNVDGGPKDRILLSGGGATVTAYNDQAQKIRTISLSPKTTISSLGIWQ